MLKVFSSCLRDPFKEKIPWETHKSTWGMVRARPKRRELWGILASPFRFELHLGG
jgi:hypothetical protein